MRSSNGGGFAAAYWGHFLLHFSGNAIGGANSIGAIFVSEISGHMCGANPIGGGLITVTTGYPFRFGSAYFAIDLQYWPIVDPVAFTRRLGPQWANLSNQTQIKWIPTGKMRTEN